jgi:hypothetical protein
LKKKKAISIVMIQFLFISASLTLLSPIGLSSMGLLFSMQDSITSSNSQDLDPNAELFLNTQWDEPLTVEQAKVIEVNSMNDLYSEPETLTYTTFNQDFDYPNETERKSQTNLNDDQVTEDVTIESLDESGWPWQPWPSVRDDFPALPIAPAMEGRWWPKKGYSTLVFDIQIDTPITDELYIWVWIVCDQDQYNRIFTLTFDGNQIGQYLLTPWTGIKSCKHIPSQYIDTDLTKHKVEMMINWCGWKDHQWKLLYGWVGNGDGPDGDDQTPPLDSNGFPYPMNELTPRTGQTHCVMEFDVLAGENTLLNIQTENVEDTTSRTVYVYFENSGGTYDWKGSIRSPGSYQVNLGEHTDNAHRKLKLVFRYLPDIDYAKRIKQLCVTHIGWKLEIDYMPYTHISTLSSHINSMNAYYKTHSYHYVTYSTSQDLDDYPVTTEQNHVVFYTYDFDHRGQAKWEYVIYVESLSPPTAAGWHYAPKPFGFRIADYGIAISDVYYAYFQVIWHEYGHHIYISDPVWGPEDPCSNPDCVMSYSTYPEEWYCFYHFWQRQTF